MQTTTNCDESPAGSTRTLRFVDWLSAELETEEASTKGDRRRLALKLAAARLLEDRGYDDFSTRDVSDAANVTRTALYLYYPSKQVLVLELLQDFQRFMMEKLRPSRKGMSMAEAALETNRTYVRFFAINARIILSIQYVRRNLSDAEKLQFDLNDWWAHKVARAISGRTTVQQRSSHPSKQALATAYALEGMIDSFLTELYVRRNPNLVALNLSEEAVAKLLTRLWLGALKGSEP
ncbi:MAG TPA: hypothetical protein DCM06_13555 [Comamonadaceae bacterium]|nr:hypothetical protein [Comamonadaceae bacterium]